MPCISTGGELCISTGGELFISTGGELCTGTVGVCTGAIGAGGRVPNGRLLILVWGYWGRDVPPS